MKASVFLKNNRVIQLDDVTSREARCDAAVYILTDRAGTNHLFAMDSVMAIVFGDSYAVTTS